MENLENIIESILFYSGDAVQKSLIVEKLEITDKELKVAVEKLEKKYDEKSGIKLLKFKDKLQFSTNSTYTESVDLVLKKTRERALSKTVIETVAIIAYKQPITRLEIEQIRGGAPADYAIRALLEHKLIEVVGRKETLGRPLLFGTTDEFLKRFNLENIDQLPNYDDLLNEIRELNKPQESTSLYKEYDVPDEEITSQENFAETIKANEESIKKIQSYKLEDFEIPSLNNENSQDTDNDELLSQENISEIEDENNDEEDLDDIDNVDEDEIDEEMENFVSDEDDDFIDSLDIKEYKN